MSSRARRTILRVILARLAPALVVLGAGCARSAPEPREVQVEVVADDGSPVAGAQLRMRGDYLGSSNALGRATLRVPGPAGAPASVALTCPSGFTPAAAESPIVWPSSPAAPAALKLRCKTEQRDAVVLVHAAGSAANLPVMVDGIPVGETDALGFAHVHVRAYPNSAFEVSLDTSANAKLSPANPSQRFQLEGSDELFVFDTTFEPQKSAAKRRASKRPGRTARGSR